MPRSDRKNASTSPPAALFDRVASILDQARGNVVRAVNTNMVLAYWLIGREIVEELQGGDERAKYGKQVMANLARQLTQRYGRGFSVTNLQNFRKFHQAYAQRLLQIQHPLGIKFGLSDAYPPIQHPPGAELDVAAIPRPMGAPSEILSPLGRELALPAKSHPRGEESPSCFSPQLTWSHYRALMRVDSMEARDFYEREAIKGGWDKRTLERQIQSLYYERMLKSAKPGKMLAEGRKLPVPASSPADALKNPYVLEFLGLPDVAVFHESDLFASKYMLFLPTEEQLRLEIEKERRLIESELEDQANA